MKILLTGAHGVVGTAVTQYSSHQYDLLDQQSPAEKLGDNTAHPHKNRDAIHIDISDIPNSFSLIDNYDAIVHLAGSSNPDAPFDQVLQNNITGTHNMLEIARHNNVDSFIFASSNHVVGQYEQEYAPDLYEPDYDFIIDHTSPVRPDSHYGSSKVAGEAWGRQYAEQYGIRFYALRLGSIRPPRWDHPYGDAERGIEQGLWERGSNKYEQQVKRLKCTWQSRADIAHMVECCLEDDNVNFGIYYGISDNKNSWLDIEHARKQLGYDPSDSADEYVHNISNNM